MGRDKVHPVPLLGFKRWRQPGSSHQRSRCPSHLPGGSVQHGRVAQQRVRHQHKALLKGGGEAGDARLCAGGAAGSGPQHEGQRLARLAEQQVGGRGGDLAHAQAGGGADGRQAALVQGP